MNEFVLEVRETLEKPNIHIKALLEGLGVPNELQEIWANLKSIEFTEEDLVMKKDASTEKWKTLLKKSEKEKEKLQSCLEGIISDLHKKEKSLQGSQYIKKGDNKNGL